MKSGKISEFINTNLGLLPLNEMRKNVKREKAMLLDEKRSYEGYKYYGKRTLGFSKLNWWVKLGHDVQFLCRLLGTEYTGNCGGSLFLMVLLNLLGLGGMAVGAYLACYNSLIIGAAVVVASLLIYIVSFTVWSMGKKRVIRSVYNIAEHNGLMLYMKTDYDDCIKNKEEFFMDDFCADVNFICGCYNQGKKIIFKTAKLIEPLTDPIVTPYHFIRDSYRKAVAGFPRLMGRIADFFRKIAKCIEYSIKQAAKERQMKAAKKEKDAQDKANEKARKQAKKDKETRKERELKQKRRELKEQEKLIKQKQKNKDLKY